MKFSIAKAAALLAALALVSMAARPQSQEDRDWTDKHFPAAFDEFFPIKQGQGDFIAVRAHRSDENDLLEFSLVLENTQSTRAIEATLREAQGASLYRQLLALHAKDPARSYDELKPDLKIREWKLSVAQCPAVAAQFQAFNNIQFVRPRDDDPMEEHPILYQFHESVGGGDSEVVEFVESRAFPRWANDTHKALDSCAAAAQAGGR
ncbi:MAG TPA: hypothetical protein VJO53_09745 [Candidatus Acidoferrales bacterium]|nr:hypothetical protein [Candidatus Acidoferrales bacterium]